ncbi:uncharacterized protein N7483_003201 [Penicillium malachiteum]|uniref:uncharacterized protein n=1 Tax=Penicillium malachiteum TaxID=1324776 RepID=UPI0025477112|nr:uncharacterized protein N7483_003201 [Penicillium malachiteum]KAJ5728693.1 hypothetical protein N7483_003201 [Penicillium malachiteum]
MGHMTWAAVVGCAQYLSRMFPASYLVTEVNEDTWLVDSLLLRRSKGASPLSTWYDQQEDFSHFVTDVPTPRPPSVPLAENHPTLKLVYDIRCYTAVFSVGTEAFCKIKPQKTNVTLKAVTLEFVHTQWPDSEVPQVFHNTIRDGRSFLFMSRVPGRTLAEAWPSLDETWKHRYVESVISVCVSLQLLERDKIGGVDGNGVEQQDLFGYGEEKHPDPQSLQQRCELLGMDCSKYVFCRLDLGPVSLIVEDVPTSGRVGFIDWESAGFFPREWLRTKAIVSVGLDIPEELSGSDDPSWWRLQRALGEQGILYRPMGFDVGEIIT